MFRVALKDLLARKRRLFTTGLAVMLGIAFLSGTQVLSSVLNDSIDSLIDDVYEGYDAVVRSPDADSVGFGQAIRSPLPASLVAQAEAVDGVRVAEGVVETTTAQLVGADGEVVGSDFGPPTLVSNWLLDETLRLGRLTEGRGPTADDEVALDFKTAEEAGYVVGDEVTVGGPDGTEQFELVGLVGLGEDGTRSSGAKVLVFDTPVAQRLGQVPDAFNYIAVAADDGVTQGELVTRLENALPGQQVLTGEQFAAESADAISQFVDILTTFVSVFGWVAIVVACFIIYNTFSILVAQRTRETALLRAIGARRRQVLTATLIEACVVGLIASLAGIVAGVLLAWAMKWFMGSFFTVESGLPSVTVASVVLAFAIGIGVSVLSSLVPAWRSTRVPPIAALSDVAIDRSHVSRARVAWGALTLLAGAALLALGLADIGPSPLFVLGAGAFLILVALALVLGPLIAAPVSRLLAKPFSIGGRVTGRLAGENAARNPKRTAATAAALTIGVTLVSLIAILASSVKASVAEAVRSSIAADYIVSAGTFAFGVGVPEDRVEQIAALDDVAVASPVRFSPVRLLDAYAQQQASQQGDSTGGLGAPSGAQDQAPPGQDDFAFGIDPATFFQVIDLGTLEGSVDDLTEGTFATIASVAEQRGWQRGDRVPFYFARTGVQELRLEVIAERDVGQGSYFLPFATFNENVQQMFALDVLVYVQATEGADLDVLRGQLDEIVADLPKVEVQDLDQFAEAQTGPIDTFLTVIYALLGLAVVIALIGIANTLSLSILERTRELGLLRAVGMSRKQVRRTVLIESSIIAVLGTLIGLVLGIGFALALSVRLAGDNPDLFLFRLPVPQLVVIVVVAALAGVVAAVLPAWRASRLDVLKAISST